MNDQESTGVSRYVAWGLVGLIILVGVSVATSLIFFASRSSGSFYPLFPLHFGLFGGIFLIFIIFLIARLLFWPWRRYNPNSYSRDRGNAREILRETGTTYLVTTPDGTTEDNLDYLPLCSP